MCADLRAAIILGASNFKRSPSLNRVGFSASAKDFVSYLLDEKFFALPRTYLLDLFDSEMSPGDQIERICDFLSRLRDEAAGGGQDVLLYYVGHGGFVGINSDYFLAVAVTREGFEGPTSIRMADLSSGLREYGGGARKYLILDCCFAATAFSQFQHSGLTELIRAQTLDPLPPRGTALLCSSGSRQLSLSPRGELYTLFSGALIEVLKTGEPSGRPAFSLEDVGRRVKDLLRAKYPEDWVRPEVHSPDMREGSVAHIPIFPNLGFDEALAVASEREQAEYVHNLESLVTARTDQLMEAMADLERSYDITLQALGDAIDLKNAEGEGHSRRVTAFTIAIARAMGVPREEILMIGRGAFLHDIGKMAIPDRILFKQGKLTDRERAILREHCYHGYQMLKKIPFLAEACDIVYSHQESFDGSGYPRGLKGNEIPLGARIFCVADTLDALTSDRPYRPAKPISMAREEIQSWAGRQFDPNIVAVFLGMPDDIFEDLRRKINAQSYPFTYASDEHPS
jgi:putative nucleotidyltransferase with HDIG domain